MRDLSVRHIQALVTGRYLVRPTAYSQPGSLLVGFHGYAENAEDHLEALLAIPGIESWHVVAIQALHPFYRRRTNDVGASWMTSRDRDRAIADNVRYVGAVVEQVRAELPIEGPMAAIGFSQGTSMAYRAAATSGHVFNGVVVLGGDLPEDAVVGVAKGFPRVLIGRGAGDEWYSAEKLTMDIERLGAVGVEPETCVFPGGHEWTEQFREACGRFLAALQVGVFPR